MGVFINNVCQLNFCRTYYPTSISTNKYFPTSISVSNDLILSNCQLHIEIVATERHSGEIKTKPNINHVKHQFDYWAF